MSININVEKLKDLMRDFYILTNIKIVIFDDQYNEILGYPDTHNAFCDIMQKNELSTKQCQVSNYNSFQACKKTGELIIYQCHAGLIEATAPIKERGIIIGYIMFGQITDIKDKEILLANICNRFQISNLDSEKWHTAIRKIKYKSIDQIRASAKILEACTYYVLLNELVSIRNERIIDKLNTYIEENLNKEITSQIISKKLNISRTKLYETTQIYLGMGIAEYVKSKRMAKAKSMLKNSEASVAEISEMIGFDDYTYFCKVFKKEFGLSPTKYRIQQVNCQQ